MTGITINPSTINSGDNVTIVATGFTPNHAIIYAFAPRGADSPTGTVRSTTDENGNQTITVGPISNPNGSYQVTASDGINTAVGYFAIGSNLPTPSLTCTPSINVGGTLSFTFYGMSPMVSVWVGVVGGGGIYVVSNSLGSGTGSFTDGDQAGNYTLSATDGSHTASASFTIGSSSNVQLTLNSAGAGSVSNSPSGTSFAIGTVVTLTATPAQGATFSGWYEGINILSTSQSYQITMNANRSILGLFTSQQTVVITPNPVSQGGKISVAVTNFLANHALTITVVETGGYWSVGATDGSGNATYTNLGPITNAPGSYSLRVSDGTNSVTVSFIITGSSQPGYSNLVITNVTKV